MQVFDNEVSLLCGALFPHCFSILRLLLPRQPIPVLHPGFCGCAFSSLQRGRCAVHGHTWYGDVSIAVQRQLHHIFCLEVTQQFLSCEEQAGFKGKVRYHSHNSEGCRRGRALRLRSLGETMERKALKMENRDCGDARFQKFAKVASLSRWSVVAGTRWCTGGQRDTTRGRRRGY